MSATTPQKTKHGLSKRCKNAGAFVLLTKQFGEQVVLNFSKNKRPFVMINGVKHLTPRSAKKALQSSTK